MKKINKPIIEFVCGIDDMTIAKKTTMLFLIMVVGMLFIGSFAHMSLNRIKGDFDVLFDKRMVPVIRLEKIKDIYTINILDTLRDVESNHISIEESKSIIYLAQELIMRDWSEYKDSKKISEVDFLDEILISWGFRESKKQNSKQMLEEDMILAIEKKIEHIDVILLNIFNLFDESQTVNVYSLLREVLYPSINSINIHLTQLISLNLEAANSGKKRTKEVYDNTFNWILAATIGTITVAGFLAFILLKNIRRLHGNLARSVDLKTKELQELNSALEDKIAKEVELSRQKDQIMFRQSRLAAMGEMVGNIAHQWRQPLNALMLVVQSFQMKNMVGKLDDAFIDSQVDEGVKLATSMSRTIDDFRNFFKPNKIEEQFSVKKVINESVDLVEDYYKKINIKMNLVDDVTFETLGYPNEFSQVMMNLFSNSKDILKEKNIDHKHIEIVISIDKKIKMGKIEVIDNGGGVPSEVMERMFEPYFTTKHQASGTGIGLYMSKEIVEQHMSGSIGVENISHKFLNDERVYENCACINIKMPIG